MIARRRGILLGTALLALGAPLAACGEGPGDVYIGMATSAEFGDREGFLAGFTPESKALVEAQISLSEAYDLRQDDPVKQLVFDHLESVETDGDKAVLEVSSGTKSKKILMVKTDEGWRIDTKKLVDFWEDEANKK
ncbi:MAG: hypothetical protein KC635_09985 [Myxococcales bacterium]|nr:hypothetical protein [Myxococcales bacterium]MCB9731279.1 hypothetical protein [Deltaproteobacteria bacterium]